MVLSYGGGRSAELWWQQTSGKVAGQKNLRVLSLSAEEGKALAGWLNAACACNARSRMAWSGWAARAACRAGTEDFVWQ
jgi:uncharacterized protein YaeQ